MQPNPIFILTLFVLWCSKLISQNDTLYFFDFENVDIQYTPAGKYDLTFNNGGTFKDAEPYSLPGRTVIRPNSSKRNAVVDYGKYDIGSGYLYHSPSWYMN